MHPYEDTSKYLLVNLQGYQEGYPNFAIVGWNGIHVPAKTPKSVIEKLNKECDNTIKIRIDSINEKLKNTTIKDKIQSSTDVYFQELIGAKSKIEQMFENSKDDRNEMSSFMRKLRERSLHFRESAFSKLSEEK